MEENYYKAYTEVFEILKFVPKESVIKIPVSMLKIFKEKRDKNYNFKIDINKRFDEQQLLNETKAILSIIYRDFWASEKQKEAILRKENYDRLELEKQKAKEYNPNNIFKNNKERKNQFVGKNENLPLSLKKENLYDKFIKFLKKHLIKNK